MFRITIVILLIGFSGCKAKEKNQPGSVKKEKADIEKVVLSDLNGNPVDVNQYKGKTVFLNFWATWCKPCLEEMPSIQKAQQILKDEDVVFLLASEETADQIREFENSHHFNFDYVRAENLAELGIMGLPTTFIYDARGKRRFSDMGFRKWDKQSNLDLLKNISKSK